MRTCTHRCSYREGPSHAILYDCCEAVAERSASEIAAARAFTMPLKDDADRVCTSPPYPRTFGSAMEP
eukprot:7928926-Pyramimonas_sp.AAC.1